MSALLLVLLALLSLAAATCPATGPSPLTSVNPPLLDNGNTPASTNIVANALGSGNTANLLQLRITWQRTLNRTIDWIGIGSTTGICDTHLSAAGSLSAGQGDWTYDNAAADCVDAASASYNWPEALYASDCKSQFSVNSLAYTQTIDFAITVAWTDCFFVVRNGGNITECSSSSQIVPVQFVFPLNVTVSTSLPVAVFSASSVQVTAALQSEIVNSLSPYTIRFLTLVGESFALAPTSEVYAGSGAITVTLGGVSLVSDTILSGSTTRQQVWEISVAAGLNTCVLDGSYTTGFNVYWTGVDGVNGASTLPPAQNPIPNNSTASVVLSIVSENFCATVLSRSISAVLNSYNTFQSDYYTGPETPHRGFLTGDTVYLAAHVTSLDLPILSAAFSKLSFVVVGSSTPTVLLTGGVPQFTFGYTSTTGGQSGVPRTDATCSFTADPSIFIVPGDNNVQYNFTADLVVTYNNLGVKRTSYVRDVPVFRGAPAKRAGNSFQLAATTQLSVSTPLTSSASSAFATSLPLLLSFSAIVAAMQLFMS